MRKIIVFIVLALALFTGAYFLLRMLPRVSVDVEYILEKEDINPLVDHILEHKSLPLPNTEMWREVNQAGSFGFFPIHAAVAVDDVGMIALLLDKGADIDKQIDANGHFEGYTALHLAIDGGKKEISQLLVNRGSDLTIVNAAGQTPIELAREKNLNIME